MHGRRGLASTSVALLLLAAAISCTQLYVATDGTDSGVCGTSSSACRTLVQAVANAPSNSVIHVGPGTYAANGSLGITFPNKYLNISSVDGFATTIIDGQNVGRIFTFSGGEDGFISGFTFKRGLAIAGGCVLLKNSNISFINSVFEDCQAVGSSSDQSIDSLATSCGGAVYIIQSLSYFINVIFTGNYAGTGAGSVWLDLGANATFQNCNFTNENSVSFGGSVVPESTSNSRFYYCTFTNCRSKFGGTIDTGSQTTTEFWYTNIINSIGDRGGAVYHFNRDQVKFYHSNFINNTAVTSGGAVAVSVSAAPTYVNCTFDGNTSGGGGGAFYLEATSSASVFNSRFTRNQAGGGGSGFFARGTTTSYLERVDFYNNTVLTYGAAVLAEDSATITMVRSRCYQNHADMEGGCFKGSNSVVISIRDTDIFNNTSNSDGGGCMFEHTVSLDMQNTTIRNNLAAASAGGILLSSSCTATLNNTRIERNNAETKGGGIAVTGRARLLALSVTLAYNTASQGGAIYAISQTPLYVGQNSTITYNNALFGGALFVDGGANETNTVENSVISYNNASAGGSFFYNVWQRLAQNTNVTFINNTAQYGAIEATKPWMMVLNGDAPQLSYSPKDRFSIGLRLIDYFNNTATKTIEQIIVQIIGLGGLFVETFIHRQAFDNGLATFDNVTVSGELGAVYPLVVSVESLPIIQWNITIHSCGIGFTKANSSTQLSYQCTICESGTYNLREDQQCKLCPTGAVCSGGSSILADEDWWLDPQSILEESPSLYRCPHLYCTGNSQCGPHRSGRLCAKCDTGFSEWNDSCQDCRVSRAPGWLSFPLMLGIVYAGLMIRFPRLTETGIPKSLVFFVQSAIILMQSYKRLSAQAFLQSFDFAFDWIINLDYNSRCVLNLSSLQKIAYSLYAPSTPIIGILFWWAVMHMWSFIFDRKITSYWNWRIVSALIWGLLWGYIMFAKAAFNLVNCRLIGKVSVLVKAPDVICGSAEHALYQVVGWVIIVLFVVGFPVVCACLLLYARKRLMTVPDYPLVKELYRSYKPTLWYYELVLTIRKLCLTLLDVLITASEVDHGVAMCIFFFVILLVQYVTQPFKSRLFNRAEDLVLMILLLVSGFSLGDTMRTNHFSDADLHYVSLGFVGFGFVIISLFIISLTETITGYINKIYGDLARRHPWLAKSVDSVAAVSKKLSAYGSSFSVEKSAQQHQLDCASPGGSSYSMDQKKRPNQLQNSDSRRVSLRGVPNTEKGKSNASLKQVAIIHTADITDNMEEPSAPTTKAPPLHFSPIIEIDQDTLARKPDE